METITFRLFTVCMLLCATCFVIGIWWGEHEAPEALFKAGGTFFIIGLANFLLWAPRVVYRFLRAIET